MQTRRQYLVGLGLAKEGRGKLSGAAHEAIKEAIAGGMQFSDLQDKPVVVKRATERPKDGNEKVTAENQYADASMRYPVDQLFKGTDSNGKTVKVNARQACMNPGAHYSIAGCFTCPTTHRVLTSSMEYVDVSPIGE